MASRHLVECLVSQKPYFGPALHALQGVPKRHAYLQAVVEFLSRENKVDFIKILEVGSWAGASAITWAKAARKYFGRGRIVCIDHWQSYFDTSINPEAVYVTMNEAARDGSIYKLFLHNVRTSGVGSLISPVIARSHDLLAAFKCNSVSVVYLDASHRFEDVQKDINLSTALVEEGGIICGDDLELQQFELDTAELTRDVATDRDYLRSESCGVFYHPGVTRAVAEAFGEVSAWEGFWAMRKVKGGWTKLDLSGCELEIPEHIAMAEVYPPEPSDDRKRLIFSINQIVDRLAKEEQQPDGLAQGEPKILASYCGFNIIRVNEYYYGVHESVGTINWELPYCDLVKQYGEPLFFRCTDKTTIVARIGLNELLSHVEKLFSIVSEVRLRQEIRLSEFVSRAGESHDQPQLLEENYRGFNLVAYNSKVWAAAMAAGPIDFRDSRAREQLRADSQLLESRSVDGAKGAVDQMYTWQAFKTEMSNLSSRIESIDRGLSELDVALGKQVESARLHDASLFQLGQWRAKTEARLAEDEALMKQYSSRLYCRFRSWMGRLLRIVSPSAPNANKEYPKNSENNHVC